MVSNNCKPCGELLELEYCRNTGVITAILSKKNERFGSWMTIDFHIHSRDFRIFDYGSEDIESLKKFVKEITRWVDTRCKERENEIKVIEKKYGYFKQ